MKLLFIENRYKTYFWEAICGHLKENHEVYWIVQNPKFSPKVGHVNIIPFPSKKVKVDDSVDLNPILESDRQQNFFNKKDTSYFYYYYQQIKTIIEKINPNIVFGECTAFHELLTIKICKEKKLLFLNPSTCRYPTGRFSFYKYDTLTPHKGSKEQLSTEEGHKTIDNIINRNVKPDYMKKASFSKKKKIKDKWKIISSYYQGELYNTPSPIIKLAKERKKKNTIKNWNELATTTIDKETFSILYPLQMQPEANIDVWGRPHRDQFKTIVKLHEQLKKAEVLYIKPNPKSKYELSAKLLSYINNHPNIVALRHDVPMDAVFNEIDLFVTVTGTIAIECVLANKPIITLVKTLNNETSNCAYLHDLKLLQTQILNIKNNNFPILSENEKIDFLNLLSATSYKGVISDPYHSSYSVSEGNINDLVKAFNQILNNKV